MRPSSGYASSRGCCSVPSNVADLPDGELTSVGHACDENERLVPFGLCIHVVPLAEWVGLHWELGEAARVTRERDDVFVETVTH
jgi:hypothetical protein